MLLCFFDLFFELCLPFFSTLLIIAVFLELSSSSIPRYANLCHCHAVFLLSPFTFSPAVLRFPESFMFFCSHRVSRSRLPGVILFALCPEEPCLFSNNMQAVLRLHMCSFDFLDNYFSQDRIHSQYRVCRPQILLLVGTKVVFIPPISCGNPWVLFFQIDLFSLSSIYLLSAPTFYLLNYLIQNLC